MGDPSYLSDGEFDRLTENYQAAGAALTHLGDNRDALLEVVAAIDARDGERFRRVFDSFLLPGSPFETQCATITKTVVVVRVGTPEFEQRRVCRWARTGKVVGSDFVIMTGDSNVLELSPHEAQAMFDALVAAGIIVCADERVKVSDGTTVDFVDISREFCKAPDTGPGPLAGMDESDSRKAPRTAGELRRVLADMGDPWTVDPRLSDDDPLPDYPRGGQREDEIPEEARLPVLSAKVDVDALLKQLPPNDPDLRKRWAEEGLLDLDPHEVEEAPVAEAPSTGDEGMDHQ